MYVEKLSVETPKDILRELKTKDLTRFLEALRIPLLKLSETNLSKPTFNQWKREGLIDNLIPKTEEKSWNKFSVTELVILQVVNLLWERDIDENKIKEVVDTLIDGTDLMNAINDFIENKDEQLLLSSVGNSKMDLLTYLVSQKKENSHLPPIANIEGFIIGSLKLDRPFSIMVYDDGTIDYFLTTILTDRFEKNILTKLLNKTFLNIPVSKLFYNIISAGTTATSGNKLSADNFIIKRYIENGYDLESLNEIFEKRRDLSSSEEKLALDVNIEKIIRGEANQNISIKIRNGKKESIRRIVINKK